MKKLRIAQIGTIWETTPPPLYGGTERIVYNLTEELVRRGHDVTLFATGDSKTSGKLESVYPRALYRDGIPWTNPLYPLLHITNAFDKADQYDIIHTHLNTRQDYVALAFANWVKTPVVITIHFVMPGENDPAKQDRLLLLKKYKKNNFVTISKAQQTLGFLNYAGVVYNGLDFSEFKFNPNPENYIAWLGRFCHDKGTYEAIQVAKKIGMKLVMGGKIDWANEEYLKYYNEKVKPEIDGKQIVYLGELGDKGKIELFRNAKAVLNPINWNEPFGLVTIEAMACGAPVIAFDNGPAREQIIEGKTGFIVKNVDEMAKAVGKIDKIDRAFCRDHAVKHFSAKAMAEGYEEVYEKVLADYSTKV
ncbi:glycosyltransferase family 4 protein [Patescibacteria group bacterium]|nr:glycosyltransferase family 4 protein [Patescibacteria group bacterium]MBU4579837.1 glycosyltransferase family 4 protein [Patescibacteria group bacterium]